jgi:hypothetical protein
MNRALVLFLSTLAAAATPAAIFAAYAQVQSPGRPGAILALFGVAFLVAFAHAMLLGLPAALVLNQRRAFRAVPMLIAGGLVGVLPIGLLWFPHTPPRNWSVFGAVAGVVFGLGASGGLAFHATFRWLGRDDGAAGAR